jgi:hypothetical protein
VATFFTFCFCGAFLYRWSLVLQFWVSNMSGNPGGDCVSRLSSMRLTTWALELVNSWLSRQLTVFGWYEEGCHFVKFDFTDIYFFQ